MVSIAQAQKLGQGYLVNIRIFTKITIGYFVKHRHDRAGLLDSEIGFELGWLDFIRSRLGAFSILRLLSAVWSHPRREVITYQPSGSRISLIFLAEY